METSRAHSSSRDGAGDRSGCTLTMAEPMGSRDTSCHHCHCEAVTETGGWSWPPSTCKGINSTKNPMEPDPTSKHPVGPQCCSTPEKAQKGLVAFPPSAGAFCVGSTTPRQPIPAGTALFPGGTG